MKTSQLLLAGVIAVGLAACNSDGISLNVSTVDNSTDNSTNTGGGGSTNPCAAYTDATNVTFRGSFDGTNCTYGSDFVGVNKPLLQDLSIPFISGVHIFQDSLFVGANVSSGAAPAGGTGPKLTIAAGNTLAFTGSADYVLINRGSQIIAQGSSAAPVVLTGFSDAVTGTAGPEDVQLWGGVVINGNGITNNCSDAERAANQCHVVSEGQPSNYGGSDNSESSGILRYVVVKHAGFEVAPGDELNGVTFNAVGSGTVVEYLQVYSTYDDGVEFFGGAVEIDNLVALYVRDDSIDYSDGYVGAVRNALVIHSLTSGNRCIEADNIGESRAASQPLDLTPISDPIITNLTCITSNVDAGLHGDSEGPIFRFGARVQLSDSIMFGGYGVLASNEMLEVESDVSLAAAAAGNTTFMNSVIVGEEAVKGTLANGDALTEWALGANPSTNGANYSVNGGNVIITDAKNAVVRVLEPGTFYTATALVDAGGNDFTMTPDSGKLGAVTRADDWTTGWTYGLHATNRGQPLWFE
jgi:hypothetical protein